MKDGVVKTLNILEKGLKYSVSTIIVVMTLITFYQVILRYVFNAPTIWSEELARYLFVWLVLLTSAIAIRKERHIRIDFFVSKLKPKMRLVTDMFGYVLILIFLLMLSKEGMVIVDSTIHQKSAGLKIPMSYPYLAIPLGAIAMIIFTLEMMVKLIIQFLNGKNGGNSEN